MIGNYRTGYSLENKSTTNLILIRAGDILPLTNFYLMKINLIYATYDLNEDYRPLPMWQLNGEIKEEQIDLETYERITSDDTIAWFENLGGQEIVYRDRSGFISELVSVSPCGKRKSVREFEIA